MSEKISEIILILNLLRFVCVSTYDLSENVPCVLKQNIYAIIFVWNVLYKSKFIKFNVSSKSTVSLLTFALNDLSIDVKEVLNFLLLLYCCQFLTLGLLIIVCGFLCSLIRHMNNYYVFLMNCPLYHYIMSILSLVTFWLEVYFSWNECGYTHFLLCAICLKYHFHPFTFSLCFSLEWKWVFGRHIIGSFFFLINPAILRLLVN